MGCNTIKIFKHMLSYYLQKSKLLELHVLEKSYHVHQMNRLLGNPGKIAHKQVDATLTSLSCSACTLGILALVWTARTCFALFPVDL